jgi:hypothetical protein
VGFSNFSDTKINKSGKKLRFKTGPKQEIKNKKLIVNWTSIQLASWYCVSLIEFTLNSSVAIFTARQT